MGGGGEGGGLLMQYNVVDFRNNSVFSTKLFKQRLKGMGLSALNPTPLSRDKRALQQLALNVHVNHPTPVP